MAGLPDDQSHPLGHGRVVLAGDTKQFMCIIVEPFCHELLLSILGRGEDEASPSCKDVRCLALGCRVGIRNKYSGHWTNTDAREPLRNPRIEIGHPSMRRITREGFTENGAAPNSRHISGSLHSRTRKTQGAGAQGIASRQHLAAIPRVRLLGRACSTIALTRGRFRPSVAQARLISAQLHSRRFKRVSSTSDAITPLLNSDASSIKLRTACCFGMS